MCLREIHTVENVCVCERERERERETFIETEKEIGILAMRGSEIR